MNKSILNKKLTDDNGFNYGLFKYINDNEKFSNSENENINKKNIKITFKDASELFMRLYATVHCKPTTYTGYLGYLKNHLIPFFGDKYINTISAIEVREFIKLKVNAQKTNNTVNKYVKLMNEIYNFLIDIELINNNPLSRIKNLKEIKNHKIRALTSNEVKILLNTTKKYDYEFYPLLFTALFTGMRQGELLGLTWNSINWNSKKITVDKNYTHGNLGTTKSGKIRIVDMSKELVQVLKRWHLRCPLSKFGLVFPNKEGNYLNAANMLNRKFKPALKRAGIEPIRFHDLRHTYASLLIANGVSMKYVQYQLGHSSIKMTMDLYTHILPEFNENCVNILDNLVNNLTKDFVQNVLTIKNYAT